MNIMPQTDYTIMHNEKWVNLTWYKICQIFKPLAYGGISKNINVFSTKTVGNSCWRVKVLDATGC